MGVRQNSVEEASGEVPLSDDRVTVAVRKVRTRNGVRLEIAAADARDRIRIDPLALESLTWQDPIELADELLGASETGRSDPTTEQPVPTGDTGTTLCEFSLVNEFAEVSVRGLRTGDREFLDVAAPRVGHRIRLSPSILDAIAHQEMGLFSEFLETPYGPE